MLVERSGREGWSVASDEGVTVALDTTLDSELELEGRVYDLIHTLNSMRKEQGLELTDRIEVTLPAEHADLLAHADWIKSEVLAVSIDTDGVAEPQIAKVATPSSAPSRLTSVMSRTAASRLGPSLDAPHLPTAATARGAARASAATLRARARGGARPAGGR